MITSTPPMMWLVNDPLTEKGAVALACVAVFMGGFSASACGPSIRWAAPPTAPFAPHAVGIPPRTRAHDAAGITALVQWCLALPLHVIPASPCVHLQCEAATADSRPTARRACSALAARLIF